MPVHLDQLRADVLRNPGAAQAYRVDAPAWMHALPPAAIARVARWAEVAGAPDESVTETRNWSTRLTGGRIARQKGMAPPPRAVTVDIGGTPLKFGLEMWISGDFFIRVMPRDENGYRIHEPGVQRTLKRLLGPETLLVDIGAHVGYFSCYAASLGATVIAVEMQPTLCDAIAMNAVLNNLWTVHTVCAAMGGEAGVAQVWRIEPRPGTKVHSERRDSEGDWAPIDSLNHDLLPVMTLDQLLTMPPEAAPRGTVVKIDVEGAEGVVLQGARRLIAERETTFIVECHPASMAAFGTRMTDIVDVFPEDRWQYTVLEDDADRIVDREALIGVASALPEGSDKMPGSILFTPRPAAESRMPANGDRPGEL